MKKIIFISGNFNVVHPGHIRLFKFAKLLKGKIVVAVKSDKLAGDLAYVNENLRLEGIKNISLVDHAFIAHEDINKVIFKMKPYYILKGKEYEKQKNPEEQIIKKINSKLIFSKDNVNLSSIDLINKEVETASSQYKNLANSYLKRHGLKKESLINIINKFKKIKICVIGDLIIDEYNFCEPLGMSREEAVIVSRLIDKKTFIGGAGVVALHGSLLGSRVDFLSVIGKDSIGKYAQKELNKFRNIKSHLVIDDSRPTTKKLRFRDDQKSLLRVSILDQNPVSLNIQNKLLKNLKKIIPNTNLLIFSDFNYGCLSKEIILNISKLLKNNNKIIIAADSQTSSQDGDISKFKKMNLITPTEKEARISVLDNEIGIENLALRIQKKAIAKNLILKLGSDGIIISSLTYDKNRKKAFKVDRIPSLSISVKDVSGAGDSLLTISSMALAAGSNIWESAFLGSIAASIAVEKIGNVPISHKDLKDRILSL
jgi:rfaE bifunctional protein kinase chain/domain